MPYSALMVNRISPQNKMLLFPYFLTILKRRRSRVNPDRQPHKETIPKDAQSNNLMKLEVSNAAESFFRLTK